MPPGTPASPGHGDRSHRRGCRRGRNHRLDARVREDARGERPGTHPPDAVVLRGEPTRGAEQRASRRGTAWDRAAALYAGRADPEDHVGRRWLWVRPMRPRTVPATTVVPGRSLVNRITVPAVSKQTHLGGASGAPALPQLLQARIGVGVAVEVFEPHEAAEPPRAADADDPAVVDGDDRRAGAREDSAARVSVAVGRVARRPGSGPGRGR